MNVETCVDLPLVSPSILPPLDSGFRPAVLSNRAFRKQVADTGVGEPVAIALEQSEGAISRFDTVVFPENHPFSQMNGPYIERLVKFLLWARGGFRVIVGGPASIANDLAAHFQDHQTGRFDAQIMGERVYERPFEVIGCARVETPAAREGGASLGRHLEGCRIGFDLGASDRKCAAVIDGRVVHSEEVVWNPVRQSDPQWHYDQIMDSLRRAAAHLPRVDAIGGSSAGIYVNNRVKVASLFRGVSPDLFRDRVRDIFLDIGRAWGDIPFEVVNDGEVTALAGSMSIGDNAILGIAMGSSEAVGYVTPRGRITTWLNELAFAPVDVNPEAPTDEWSGDYGCGAQYFSQQAVSRLMPTAGIPVAPELALPEKLRHVQDLMARGDRRARLIYETIGVYLGYALAHYADFYTLSNVLILGRVTTGEGGEIVIDRARAVLRTQFPELDEQIAFHIPDEQMKRHGQAIAAASLPEIASVPAGANERIES